MTTNHNDAIDRAEATIIHRFGPFHPIQNGELRTILTDLDVILDGKEAGHE